MAFPPLYILRHGETEWNATGRLQGGYDSDLTPQGKAQARQQNRILQRCDVQGYTAITSPQRRAKNTAQIALNGLDVPLVEHGDLREIGLGLWAGQNRATLIAEQGVADGFALYPLAPGGEGFDALRARCLVFLQGLTGPSILITHGLTSRMLRLIATGQGTDRLREIGGGQGVVFELRAGVQNRLTLGA